MKKTYIKPALEQVTVATESLLQTMSISMTSEPSKTITSNEYMGAKYNTFDLWGEDEE